MSALGGSPFFPFFFPTSVAILATSLLEAIPAEQGKPSSIPDTLLELSGEAFWIRQSTEIDKCLVYGYLLDIG